MRTGTYANLFTAISTNFGTANGTSFNVPDLRGLFLRGVDGSAGRDVEKTARTPMAIGGAASNAIGSVQGDDNKAHTHSMNYQYHSPAVYPSGLAADSVFDFRSATTVAGGINRLSSVQAPSSAIQSSGGAESRPKNAYVNYIIKY